MSSLNFCSLQDTAVVHGRELHRLNLLIARTALGLADAGDGRGLRRWAPLLIERPSALTEEGFRGWFEISWIGSVASGAPLLAWRGVEIATFDVGLNTALAIGSDPLKLAARLVGQAPIHPWVAGPDRTWLARIITRGLDDGVLRPGNGWEQAATLLASRSEGPVVLAVSEVFPDFDELAERGFADSAAQWDQAVAELKADTGARLQLTPTDWEGWRFEDGLSVLDLIAPGNADRLDAALS